ncbi:stem-specific protein TSJT1-like, partial [Cajanus cajan]
MLGIFNEKLVNAPKELKSPACLNSCSKGKERDEMMKDLMRFGNWWNGLWMRFGNGDGVLGYAPSMDGDHNHNQRLFSVLDDIYCVFLGELHNLSMLNKQYGLSKGGNEAMFIIQAYRTLRDRAPYPAHQVLKELEGSFGFLIYDNRDRTLFLASASNAHIPLYWGIAPHASLVISEN